MNASEKLAIPSLKERVSPEEWQTRVDLAACYRLAADFGWSGCRWRFSSRCCGA